MTTTPLQLTTSGLGSSYAWSFGTFTQSRAIEPVYGTANAGAVADLDTALAADLAAAGSGVIVSLDVVPGAFAYVVEGATATAFTMTGSDVGSAELAGFVAAQGSAGSVVTAVSASPTAGLLRVYASGKAGDTTAYDTSVVSSTAATYVADVSALAGSGFVVTAVGHVADDALVLVGTRGPNASYSVTEQTDEIGPTGIGSGAVVGWIFTPSGSDGSGSGSADGSDAIVLEQ